MSFPLHSADLSHSLGKGLGFLSRCLYSDCFSHQEVFPSSTTELLPILQNLPPVPPCEAPCLRYFCL